MIGYDPNMESPLNIDVSALDARHRRAIEEVIGRQLTSSQRLRITVFETEPAPPSKPAQTLDDWTHVYDGLSEEEIEAVDTIAKTRANLTRQLP
jgi:hypothetical protein